MPSCTTAATARRRNPISTARPRPDTASASSGPSATPCSLPSPPFQPDLPIAASQHARRAHLPCLPPPALSAPHIPSHGRNAARFVRSSPRSPSALRWNIYRIYGDKVKKKCCHASGRARLPSVIPGPHTVTPAPSYRHTRTCSGYPCGCPVEAMAGDARNKSGHDGEACPEPVEGGVRAGADRRRIGDAAHPRPLPFSLAQRLNGTAMDLFGPSARCSMAVWAGVGSIS